MRISDVEKLVGISKKNIRFYEEQGLLSPGRESQNGYRSYTDEDIERLRRVKLLRKLAVPIEDIRKLQGGSLSLSDCMRRHEIYLNGQVRSLEHIRTICGEMIEAGGTIEDIDAEQYEQRIEALEKGGVSFMKITSDGDKRRRKLKASVWAAIFCALFLSMVVLLIWSSGTEPTPQNVPPPLWVAVLIGAIFVFMAIGVIMALMERFKEIDKGEEDEAFKY